MMDILWANDHGAMGLPVAEVLPRLPFSRALVQACSPDAGPRLARVCMLCTVAAFDRMI